VLVRDRERMARLRLERELMAARRIENVGHLAGGVAHDFNNMLTAMIGYMDLVSAGLPAGAEEQGYLAQALDAAEQATDLTRQMLAFARRQPGPPIPQDLGALVDRLAPLARRLMPESVSLVAPHRADPAWVLVDAGQLEQVVVTLALRARDAMPDGGVLTLSTIEVPGEGDAPDCVALEAVDTGAGPDIEALRRSLEAVEAPGDDSRDLRSAGVATLVRASGGRIEADRDANGRTRLRALWPLADPPGGRADAGGGVQRGKETVLFVEDDPATRDLVVAMLARLGYDVHTAGGADEALLWLDKHPGRPHLLLADLVLPGMSGRELALRAREAWPGMRVLLTSGYAASPGATEVAGGLPFLPKPFTRDLLARRVRETLDAPPAGAGGASV
jgi:two-component system, cell cycle sensor histidine kinase and response regulator CckA